MLNSAVVDNHLIAGANGGYRSQRIARRAAAIQPGGEAEPEHLSAVDGKAGAQQTVVAPTAARGAHRAIEPEVGVSKRLADALAVGHPRAAAAG